MAGQLGPFQYLVDDAAEEFIQKAAEDMTKTAARQPKMMQPSTRGSTAPQLASAKARTKPPALPRMGHGAEPNTTEESTEKQAAGPLGTAVRGLVGAAKGLFRSGGGLESGAKALFSRGAPGGVAGAGFAERLRGAGRALAEPVKAERAKGIASGLAEKKKGLEAASKAHGTNISNIEAKLPSIADESEKARLMSSHRASAAAKAKLDSEATKTKERLERLTTGRAGVPGGSKAPKTEAPKPETPKTEAPKPPGEGKEKFTDFASEADKKWHAAGGARATGVGAKEPGVGTRGSVPPSESAGIPSKAKDTKYQENRPGGAKPTDPTKAPAEPKASPDKAEELIANKADKPAGIMDSIKKWKKDGWDALSGEEKRNIGLALAGGFVAQRAVLGKENAII